MLENTLLLVTVLLVSPTIIPFFPSKHWLSRVWEFPRIQIACLAVFSAILSINIQSSNLAIALVIINLLVAIYQAVWILPYTLFFPKQVPSVKGEKAYCSIKILTSNVLMSNHNADKLINLIAEHQPDIIVTLETDNWWQKALTPIHPNYPHRVNQALDNLYGMHLYSKFELQGVQVRDLIENNVPSIHCYLVVNESLKIKCHFLHPAPPSPTENEYSRPRDQELLLIAREVKSKAEPTIVTGDLNDIAWSPTTRAFRHISGLKDPRIGRGMYNTFHAKYPFMRWPLDHIFHSDHFELVKLTRLPSIGSDHFPLLSDLAYIQRKS